MLYLVMLLQLILAIGMLGELGLKLIVTSALLVLLIYIWAYTSEPKGSYHALEREQIPWLYDGVAKMAKKAGIRMPKIYLLEDYIPNAYSFKNTLVFSLGLFEVLGEEEILAVAAHEIGHIKNGDTKLFPVIAYSRYLMMLLTLMIVVVTKSSLVSFTSLILYALYEMSRAEYLKKREFGADHTALGLLDVPLSLKHALEELKYYEDLRENVKTNALPSIEPSIDRKQGTQIIETHPSYDERILRILLEINPGLPQNRLQ